MTSNLIGKKMNNIKIPKIIGDTIKTLIFSYK